MFWQEVIVAFFSEAFNKKNAVISQKNSLCIFISYFKMCASEDFHMTDFSIIFEATFAAV